MEKINNNLIGIEYIDFHLNKLIADKDMPAEYKTKFLEDFEKGKIPYVDVRTEYYVGGLKRTRIDYFYPGDIDDDSSKHESFEHDNYVEYRYDGDYKNSIYYSLEVGGKVDSVYLVVRRGHGSLCVSLGYFVSGTDHWITEKDVFTLDLSRENMEKYYKPRCKADVECGYEKEARHYSCGESMANPWKSGDCLNWRITTVDYSKTRFVEEV